MASFCSGCGFPQGPNATFCPNCGTRVPGAPGSAPVTAPIPPAAVAPAAGTSNGLKIVLVLVAVLGLFAVAAIGGMYYVAHRVKQAVVEKAKEAGVELPSLTAAHSSATPRHIPKPCQVLSNSEVSELLGQPIERSEMQEESCNYYGPPGLTAKLASEHAGSMMQKVKKQGGDVSGNELMGTLGEVANSIGAQQGGFGSRGDAPFLMLMLDPDGKAQMAALAVSKSLFNGMVNAADNKKDLSMGSEVPNLGDRAIRLQRLGLNVLKGELLIRVMTGPVPDSDAKSIEIARAVLKKLD